MSFLDPHEQCKEQIAWLRERVEQLEADLMAARDPRAYALRQQVPTLDERHKSIERREQAEKQKRGIFGGLRVEESPDEQAETATSVVPHAFRRRRKYQPDPLAPDHEAVEKGFERKGEVKDGEG